MKDRNKNLDIFRAVSLLLVVFYHSWVISGSSELHYSISNVFIKLGGEIGVTAFFLLSGWGIFNSLDYSFENNKFSYWNYLKKRFMRIGWEYYISIFIVLFFTAGAAYFSSENIKNVVATLFFVQNFSPYIDSVSGVLWTMAVTVQFYLLAPVLYKLINRFKLFIPVVVIIATIFFKYIFIHYGMFKFADTSPFYWSRKILLSDLDNFVLGMGVALYHKRSKRKNNIIAIGGAIISIILLYFVATKGMVYGIHTDNWSGYMWHSMVAIIIAIGMYCFGIADFKFDFFSKPFMILSKHEYGIYIVHLLVIQSLFGYSAFFQNMASNHARISIIMVSIISILIGLGYSVLIGDIKKGYEYKMKR